MREKILRLPVQESPVFRVQLAGVTYPDRSYYIKREKCDLWVLEAVTAGCGTVRVDEAEFQVRAGDVYILPAFHRHEYFSDPEKPFEKIWFNLHGTLVDALMRVYGLEDRFHLPGAELEEEFIRYFRLLSREGLSVADILNEGADGFHRLLRVMAKSLPETPLLPPEKARILKKYIDEHIEKRFTTEELSGLIFHSPSQTIRIFRSAYGRTPYDYILEKKMQRACVLLAGTNLQVAEIAERLQFADAHYFSATFRKRVGVSPREYRKTH